MTPLLRRIMLVAFLVALPATAPRADTFLSALDDVPVMPGFVEDVDAAVSFDTANGRIASARISGSRRPGVDAGALLAFYGASLPALGWRAESPTRFRRDGEVLRLTLDSAGAGLALRFDLRPD